MGENITAINDGKNVRRAYTPMPCGPWKRHVPSQGDEPVSVECSLNPPLGFPLFHTASCSSTMDIAWVLHDRNEFPVWSSVLTDHQHCGRGQFGRSWVSHSGNLYASLRINVTSTHPAWAAFLPALAINGVLKSLGLPSEFKWPNDILVHRKKVGGILVEERSGTVIAGIGLNMSQSPSMEFIRDPGALPAGHLHEWGLTMTPLEIWPVILKEIVNLAAFYSSGNNSKKLVKTMETILAFAGDRVVFHPPDGPEFQAVVSGLSDNGGIRLKTVDGEKTFLSGSCLPVVH